MDNGKKNTPQVFTTSDIRKHARNWTLAGDVGLLALLEQFSESIINKTQETQNNLSELVNDYEELYTKLGNVTNQFLALQNCQFVENRVYDEETPTEEKTEVKVPDEAEQEKLLLMQYKQAVEIGVKLLDTHFQEIQLPPNSDSDEEDEVSPGNSVMWKPKNLYAGKKFPLLIGSAEWWADDNVGLGTNEEILDSDKIISESESDIESLKSIDKPLKSSSSSSVENMDSFPTKTSLLESSEDLFGFNKTKNIKSASDDLTKSSNSMLDEPSNSLPDFDKEPSAETNKRSDSFTEDQGNEQLEKKQNEEGITIKPEKVDNEFTRELMAKLVSVTNKTKEKKEESKDGVKSIPTVEKHDENLFDETDDSSDLFSTSLHKVTEKPTSKNIFFDAENDDDLFKGKSALFSGGDLFESDGLNDIESQRNEQKTLESAVEYKIKEKEKIEPKKSLLSDLFEDLDDDDTLFAVKPVNNKTDDQSFPRVENDSFKVGKPVDPPGMFWDNDEGLFDSINTEIDHTLDSSSDLFDNKIAESKASADLKAKEKVSDLFPKEPEINRKTKKDGDIERRESSYDSHMAEKVPADHSFDDLFGFSSSAWQGNNKISAPDKENDDELFSKSVKEEIKPVVKIVTVAENEDEEENILFGEKSKPPDSVSVSSSRSSLFDDVSASKSRLASVFEKDKNNKPEDDLFSEGDVSLFSGDTKPEKDLFSKKSKKEKSSLFDDWDDGDDLFGVAKKEDSGEKPSSEQPFGDSIKNVEQGKFEEEKPIAWGGESFSDTLGDDDLFRTSLPATKPRQTKSDILRHSSQKLFVDDLDDPELFSDNTETIKPKPPNSLSIKVPETESKGKTVGKLNIPDNLKIRFESAAKNISQKVVKPSEEEKSAGEKKEEILDESVRVSTLLKCPSKDRVKIPGRRRPQSRRARQEAIRNSGIWDQSTLTRSTSNVTQTCKDSLSSPVRSNPLSPSTDEEDFFKVPELDTNFEKEDQSIFKSDLFESSKTSKLDDSLLFDGAPVLSPPTPKKAEEPAEKDEPPKKQETNSLFKFVKPKAKSIFYDDDDDLEGDDDESLFKTPKPTFGDSSLLQTHPKTEGKLRKSFFDSNDDDKDDLFGGTSQITVQPPAHDKPKEGEESKEKGSSSFVDPLGLIK